jgi:phosphoesterase RecJ-like protein
VFDPVIDLIERKDRFLITGHHLPDGDCLGAQTALFHLLRSLGKDVRILNSDPLPRLLDVLLGRTTPFEVYRPGSELPGFEVLVLVDCHQLGRLGVLAEAVRTRACERLVVDHHVGAAGGDGTVFLIDETAPATGALVYDLYRAMGAPLSLEAATGVFISLVTDTGWFRYRNTDDHALAIAADLVARGVEPGRIYDALYRDNPAQALQLLGRALALSRLEAGGRIAVCAMDRRLLDDADQCGWDTEEVLEPLRSVGSVEVVVLLKEKRHGEVKVSLRSREQVDVDGIARALGGGGHKRASGAEIPGPLAAAEARVLAAVRQLLEVAT